MDRFYHYVDLRGLGGIEMLFRAFVLHARAEGFKQGVVLKHPGLAPSMEALVSDVCDIRIDYKQPAGKRLPAWPRVLRQKAFSRHLARGSRGPLLVWSQLNASGVSRGFQERGNRVVHHEHGAAWLSSADHSRRRYLAGIDAVVCNSRAARRVLELHWRCRAPIEVIPNPLRPDLSHDAPSHRQSPRDGRRVRIGMAGRLVPIKGMGSGISILRHLVACGHDCELHIAGEGPQAAQLRAWAHKLGVENRVHFHGFVAEMGAFFDTIDVFLCPSLREPFGLVSVEAASRGCPVVATRVDGLPETLLEGESGYTVPATMAPDVFEGPCGGPLPERVYDPDTDALRPPKLIEPERGAEAVAAVLRDPVRFEWMSRAAVTHAHEAFSFDRYFKGVVGALQG